MIDWYLLSHDLLAVQEEAEVLVEDVLEAVDVAVLHDVLQVGGHVGEGVQDPTYTGGAISTEHSSSELRVNRD